MHTEWFQELESLQRRQDEIDRQEYQLLDYTNSSTIVGTIADKPVVGKKSVGRPATDWRLEQKVLDLFDESIEQGNRLSLRTIAGILNNKVKYLTVRRILLDHRKEQFLTTTRDEVSNPV